MDRELLVQLDLQEISSILSLLPQYSKRLPVTTNRSYFLMWFPHISLELVTTTSLPSIQFNSREDTNLLAISQYKVLQYQVQMKESMFRFLINGLIPANGSTSTTSLINFNSNSGDTIDMFGNMSLHSIFELQAGDNIQVQLSYTSSFTPVTINVLSGSTFAGGRIQ